MTYKLDISQTQFEGMAKLIVACINSQKTQEEQDAHVLILNTLLTLRDKEAVGFDRMAEFINLVGAASSQEEKSPLTFCKHLQISPSFFTLTGVDIMMQITEQDRKFMNKLKFWYDERTVTAH